MIKASLGQLKKVDLRAVWDNEASDFTPWLAKAENLKLLGDAIGLELELEAQEKDVGPYRADILCKDTSDGNWVLIENQLEVTDHSHLGQILTYAAGLNAVTIVWIARRFTDEHRATINWLNEVTGEEINFFGLEVEVWQIGDSAKAPKFNIVAQPNEWTKGGGATSRIKEAELTDSKKLQLGFWRAFREYVLSNAKIIKSTKPLPQHWMNIAIGKTGFKLNAIASLYDSESESYEKNEIRAEFEINDKVYAKKYYQTLLNEKAAIEAEVGEPLCWYNPEKAMACRIYLRKTVNLKDETAREQQMAWLLNKLEILHKVFAGRIKTIVPMELNEAETE